MVHCSKLKQEQAGTPCQPKECGRRTLPARGMRKGSVQTTNLRMRASREALTAMDSSMGSSGGTTAVMIMVQCRYSLNRSLSGSCQHNAEGQGTCRQGNWGVT